MILPGPSQNWHPEAPASDAAIEQLIADCPMQLPEAYLAFLRLSNGGTAELSETPWAADFWAAEDIIALNDDYGVGESAPGFLAFGSNMGEEMLVFDKRHGAASAIYFISWAEPSKEDVLRVADSFEALIKTIKQAGDD